MGDIRRLPWQSVKTRRRSSQLWSTPPPFHWLSSTSGSRSLSTFACHSGGSFRTGASRKSYTKTSHKTACVKSGQLLGLRDRESDLHHAFLANLVHRLNQAHHQLMTTAKGL